MIDQKKRNVFTAESNYPPAEELLLSGALRRQKTREQGAKSRLQGAEKNR
jgi:hypothetical protein